MISTQVKPKDGIWEGLLDDAINHHRPPAIVALTNLVRLVMWRNLKKHVEDEVTLPALTVSNCVEINQCVGCTRQFFTKSFLGDDAAVLARSSGEEPASPRHRAGVASMAWRTTR